MLVVSVSYQIYQNDVVNYRLADEGGVCWRCESANLWQKKYRDTLDHHLTMSLLYKNPLKCEEEQLRHNI
jgi:hypothetical protein